MSFKYLAIIISLMLSISAQAQSSKSKVDGDSFFDSVSITPTIGTIVMDLEPNYEEAPNFSPLPGFAIGLEATLQTTSPYVDYQTGLLYSRSRVGMSMIEFKTFNDGNSWDESKSSGTFQIERISLPITARVFPWRKSSNFYLKGGVLIHHQMRIFLDGSWTVTSGQANSSEVTVDSESFNTSFGGKDDVRTIVPDAVLGVGYSFGLTNSFGIDTELAFQRSLLSLTSAESDALIANALYLKAGARF